MRSFHIITFGCQMNEHDSERMSGILREQGYRPASAAADADMIILNTCSIREKAEQKFYSELGRLTRLRNAAGKRPAIAVAGCIAQQEGRRILSRVADVDMIIGPSDIPRLREVVDRHRAGEGPVVETSGDAEYHRKSVPAVRAGGGVKAWISIMYGCDNFCTYCVVPHLRGRERSRPLRDIVEEVRGLAVRGYREVTLLGQNVNSYGKGCGDEGFPDLLRAVHEVDGIERIRFVTSHPKDLSADLIDAIAGLPKVCEALHLPVQSGSDRVLQAMNRKYTAAEYRERVRRLRERVPDIALTTDIIVGFPGETGEDFEATLALLRDVQYDGLFAFKYSPRPNTAALALPGHLQDAVKEERLAQVFELQREATGAANRRHVGTIMEVLIDGRSRRGDELTGRTRGNKVVNLAGPADLIGGTVSVRILSAGPNSLAGELCE